MAGEGWVWRRVVRREEGRGEKCGWWEVEEDEFGRGRRRGEARVFERMLDEEDGGALLVRV